MTLAQLTKITEELYSLLDKNNDGCISRPEIEQFLIANA